MAEEPDDDGDGDRPEGTEPTDEPSDSGATADEEAADGEPVGDEPDDSESADGESAAQNPDEETVDEGQDDPPVATDDDFNSLAADDSDSAASTDSGATDPDGGDGESGDGDASDLNEAYGLSDDPPETPPARDDHAPDAEADADGAEVDGEEADEADAGAAAGGESDADAAGDAPASDGGYADDAGSFDDDYEAGGPAAPTVEGAPDDEEMPLADHIEEMVRRLGVVVVVMAVVSGLVFPFGADLINFLWYSYLPGSVAQCPEAAVRVTEIEGGGAACPRVYHPLALILARLKIATLAGFIVALPVFVYETYLFMRPGLYLTERRYYLASVPTSLVLASAGVAFAHFLVIPAIFTYFVYYSENATVIAFGLTETFDLMVLLMGGFAIIFQIPLFIMLALMMGLVTRRWMTDRRLIFWGVFAGLAFLFSPDPTGMAPIIVAATMIVLFEGTLLLAKWTGRE